MVVVGVLVEFSGCPHNASARLTARLAAQIFMVRERYGLTGPGEPGMMPTTTRVANESVFGEALPDFAEYTSVRRVASHWTADTLDRLMPD